MIDNELIDDLLKSIDDKNFYSINKSQISFETLWFIKEYFSYSNFKLHLWGKFNIYATINKDIEMNVWNQKYPYEENITKHIAKSGTKVLIWMISRFGDIGVTDNLINPNGYDTRGLDCEKDLINFDFRKK